LSHPKAARAQDSSIPNTPGHNDHLQTWQARIIQSIPVLSRFENALIDNVSWSTKVKVTSAPKS
jgi:hypothetical protein